MRRKWTPLWALLLLGLLGAPGRADILELKNGRLLKGKFVGGNASEMKFEADGKTLSIRLDDIDQLTLERASRAVARPPAGQPAAQPAAQPGAAAGSVTVLAGTPLLVRMVDGVDSKTHKSGHRFTAKLEAPLIVNGRTVAPAGTTVYGRLASAKKGGRMARRAELKLELNDLMLGQNRVPLVTGGCAVKGERQRTAGKVAVGAGIGALADGSKGAKKGAAVGLGVAALTRGKQVQVPAGTLLEFQLQQPLTLQLQ